MIIHLDFETRSRVDVDVGPTAYFRHPSTEILCACYSVDDSEPVCWDEGALPSLHQALFSKPYIVAHNAAFELQALRKLEREKGWPHVDASQMIDTQALASACGLPRALDNIASVLGIEGKHKGKDVMKVMCKPGKDGAFPWSPEMYAELVDYCKQDVRIEMEVYKILPRLSSAVLPKLWVKHIEVCERGFYLDEEFIAKVEWMQRRCAEYYGQEIERLTKGELKLDDMRRPAFLVKWLAKHGVHTPTLRAEDVQRILAQPLPPIVKGVLEARAQSSKSSMAKLERAKEAMLDSRLCDGFVFHGAGPGRFAGAGMQPQNFPRTSDYLDHYIWAVENCNFDALFLASNGEPAKALTECLRPCIAAPPGKKLIAADLAAIEARGVLWFAKSKKGMEVFRASDEGRGPEPYCWMGGEIYKRPIDKKIDKIERNISKVAVLGLGYGMSGKERFDKKAQEWVPSKFELTARKFNLPVDKALALRCWTTYHEAFPEIKECHQACEDTARLALEEPGWHQVPGVQPTFYSMQPFGPGGKYRRLVCRLPSGRCLSYMGARLGEIKTVDEDGYTEIRKGILYDRWLSMKKKWLPDVTYAGKLVENIVQGFCADILFGAMLRMDKRFEIVLHAHDEIVSEIQILDGEKESDILAHYISQITERPSWATDLPIKAEGWVGQRYKKG